MPTISKIFSFLLIITVLASCNQVGVADLPPIEPEGNMLAIFEPGQKLQVQAAITGYIVDVIEDDSTRINSQLYKNDTLIESFHLKSQTIIEMGQDYQLKAIIDNEYEVAGSISIPQDSLVIDSGRVVRMDEPIIENNNRNPTVAFIWTYEVNVPSSFQDPKIYLSRGNPGERPFFDEVLFPDGERCIAIPRKDQFEYSSWTRTKDRDQQMLYHISEDFYNYVMDLRNPLMEQEVVPGNISFSNLERGTGLIAYQIRYRR